MACNMAQFLMHLISALCNKVHRSIDDDRHRFSAWFTRCPFDEQEEYEKLLREDRQTDGTYAVLQAFVIDYRATGGYYRTLWQQRSGDGRYSASSIFA